MATGCNRVYRSDLNGGNENGTFNEHDECMREFRRSHPNVVLVNGSRLDKADFLKRLPSLQVRYLMMETGGAKLCGDATDWQALIPGSHSNPPCPLARGHHDA